jgi:large subunit ribosomal protein L24
VARQNKLSRHFRLRSRGEDPKGTKHLEKLHVKTDDIVLVLSGDDKGKRGKVMRAIPAEGMVVVEGINKKFKHLARSQENPQGGRIEREYPIHACKVKKVEG